VGFIGDAIGSIVGGITGSNKAAKGAQQAAQTQAASAEKAIAEARAARLDNQTLQQPFVDAGGRALAAQLSLVGLNGTTGQQDAINALLTSPEYTTSIRQGEEAILQNAAATGNLRGGDTQNSLARFRSDLLANIFARQYDRLGGLTSIGQNAAAGVGNAGMNTAANIGTLYGQQGAALAGGQIAMGNRNAMAFNNALKIAGTVAGGF
jgi:hypothetical protein